MRPAVVGLLGARVSWYDAWRTVGALKRLRLAVTLGLRPPETLACGGRCGDDVRDDGAWDDS
ncbi:MAG TPA: hypothetical protein DFR83_15645 [Deltaproteobacteria bacterium]|nr:hypothetical protein [Deltaproteobacteria bacterium]